MTRLRFCMLLAVLFVPSLATTFSTTVHAQTAPIDIVAPGDQEVYIEPFRDRVRRGYLSPVSEFFIELAQGEAVTIETANLSSGSDPMLHLLSTVNSQELQVNDNGAGGNAARIAFTANEAGNYIVVLRAKLPESGGTADLLLNGQLWQSAVPFAGWQNAYSDLKAGETLQTVHQPNGAGSPHTLYVLKPDNLGIELRKRGGGPHGAAQLELATDLGRRIVIAGVNAEEHGGWARLIRNDAGISGHDPDADGLGSELEASLGTCSTLSGYATGFDDVTFDCSQAADPRDTDGDGISDGFEVLGTLISYNVGPNIRRHESLPLPEWGADPRHKDLFVEIDFMMKMPTDAPQRLSASVARQFASYYQDTLDDPDPLIDAYRAAILRNPDHKRGINVHLDTGQAPETPDDATTYGDWGGYTVVAPVQNEDGSWQGADPQQAWMTEMSPARRGIFRYILAYPSGGGQNPYNTVAASGPMNDAWVLGHEFGHSMGLGHSGPPGATGVVDPNCKPNYQSMMNYGFQSSPTVGFSDGLGTPSINNAKLREWEAVSPTNTAYLDVLENTFKYWVDREHGHVDWNRDGEIAPDGTTVRAYANYKPGGGGCEFTRYNQSTIENAASIQSPAMARLGNRLYVFYSVLGSVYYTYSTDAGNCPVPDTTACATWTNPEIAYMDAQGGIDVVKVGDGADAALLIVTIDNAGNIWERRLSVDSSGNEQFTDHRQIAGLAAKSEPTLSDLGYCKIFLAYRGQDGNVRYNRLSCADNFSTWQGEQRALDQNGSPIAMADYASPGIGRAFLSEPGLAEIYGAFADINGRLNLYQFNEATSRWDMTDLLEGQPGPIEGRPALEWTSENIDIDYPGKFYLMYIDHDTNANRSFRQKRRVIRMMMSYVKVEKQTDGGLTKTLKVGLNGPFDNVWLYGFGIDLFFEAGTDSNLMSVASLAMGGDRWATLQFRPKADGINDFNMTDYNDWEVLRLGLCSNVVNPGGLVEHPIVCPMN